ncbi:MAG TPA: hypothetical protein VIL18_06135 [Longimicrobiales bacterium]
MRILLAGSLEPGQILGDTAELLRLDVATRASTPQGWASGPDLVWTGRGLVPLPITINTPFVGIGDALHIAAGPDFRIRVLEAEKLLEVYGVARPRRSVTRDAIETYTEFYTRAIDDPEQRREYLSGMDHPGRPELLPGYDQILLADDGNVWAQVYWPDLLAPATWDVFAASREWLGQVRTPEGFSVSAIAGGHLVGVWRDTLGMEYVRVYRLAEE